jgi:hypothetical protein
MIVKLEAVNALAQLIAASGVIVSLFYLATQIRQNTRSTRAVVVDSLAHALVEFLGQHTQRPELIRSFSAVTENWHGATEEDRARALPFIFATFKLFENAWFQQRQDTLDRQQWEGLHSHLFSPARSKDVVDNAARSFCNRVPRLSRKEPTC